MNITEYQKIINKTAIYPKEIGLLYCTLGLAGEAGEICNKVKKIYRDKEGVVSDEDKAALSKELGDVTWYITATANELGLNMSNILQDNYDKLIDRRERGVLAGSGDNR